MEGRPCPGAEELSPASVPGESPWSGKCLCWDGTFLGTWQMWPKSHWSRVIQQERLEKGGRPRRASPTAVVVTSFIFPLVTSLLFPLVTSLSQGPPSGHPHPNSLWVIPSLCFQAHNNIFPQTGVELPQASGAVGKSGQGSSSSLGLWPPGASSCISVEGRPALACFPPFPSSVEFGSFRGICCGFRVFGVSSRAALLVDTGNAFSSLCSWVEGQG